MWPHNRAFLWTDYSLGLRLQEGLALELGDIDSARMLVHVHRGKGAKDRFVPLPARTLAKLRDHWATHRHPRLSFPALGWARNSPAKPSSGSCGSSQAIRALAADRRFFGDAQPGFFGVLDTWDRALGYHPHVHYVVPGEAVAADGNSWITSGPAFFLPVKALSILFRAKSSRKSARRGSSRKSIRTSGNETGSSTQKPSATAARR